MAPSHLKALAFAAGATLAAAHGEEQAELAQLASAPACAALTASPATYATVVDVRCPEEFASAHAPGAVQLQQALESLRCGEQDAAQQGGAKVAVYGWAEDKRAEWVAHKLARCYDVELLEAGLEGLLSCDALPLEGNSPADPLKLAPEQGGRQEHEKGHKGRKGPRGGDEGDREHEKPGKKNHGEGDEHERDGDEHERDGKHSKGPDKSQKGAKGQKGSDGKDSGKGGKHEADHHGDERHGDERQGDERDRGGEGHKHHKKHSTKYFVTVAAISAGALSAVGAVAFAVKRCLTRRKQVAQADCSGDVEAPCKGEYSPSTKPGSSTVLPTQPISAAVPTVVILSPNSDTALGLEQTK